jgi:prophage regulatory protein
MYLMVERHLRFPAVEAATGLSRSSIYNLMAQGRFPRPVKITTKTVAWPESVIADWLAGRAKVPVREGSPC